MKQYLDIMKDIMDNGVKKEDRTGTGTISTFGQTFRHKFENGFPLLTTKRVSIKNVFTELNWFLGAHLNDEKYINCGKTPITNIKYLDDNKNTIWREWADEDGDLGKIYGYQWNNWETFKIDEYGDVNIIMTNQIDNLIKDLKNNPDSRRLIVNAWNAGQLDEMNLPPCHFMFQCYSHEMTYEQRIKEFTKHILVNNIDIDNLDYTEAMNSLNFPKRYLSLKWTQRSCDFFLGIPYNIASYSLLTYMLAMVTNHIPYEIIGDLGDTHLYLNHIDYATEQLARTPKELPTLKINRQVTDIRDFKFDDFSVIGYDPYPNWKNVPIAV